MKKIIGIIMAFMAVLTLDVTMAEEAPLALPGENQAAEVQSALPAENASVISHAEAEEYRTKAYNFQNSLQLFSLRDNYYLLKSHNHQGCGVFLCHLS